jgi:ankyrin repeat protein
MQADPEDINLPSQATLLHTVHSLLTITKKIGEVDPDVLKTVDDDGRNALYIACEVSSSSSLIEDLASLNPGAMTSKDDSDMRRSALGKACQREDLPLDTLEALIDKCPRHGWPCCGHNPNIKDTILHELCIYGDASMEVFRLLVDKFPECLLIRGLSGNTPLNLACMCGKISVDIVELLIDACPQALMETDTLHQNTPLHDACDFKRSTEIIVLLLNSAPYALKMRNSNGEYPLHLVPATLTVGALNQMIEGYPKALRQLTNQFMTPLYSACTKRPLAPVQNLVCLVEGFPLASLILGEQCSPFSIRVST